VHANPSLNKANTCVLRKYPLGGDLRANRRRYVPTAQEPPRSASNSPAGPPTPSCNKADPPAAVTASSTGSTYTPAPSPGRSAPAPGSTLPPRYCTAPTHRRSRYFPTARNTRTTPPEMTTTRLTSAAAAGQVRGGPGRARAGDLPVDQCRPPRCPRIRSVTFLHGVLLQQHRAPNPNICRRNRLIEAQAAAMPRRARARPSILSRGSKPPTEATDATAIR
jgi:hypothetical protein